MNTRNFLLTGFLSASVFAGLISLPAVAQKKANVADETLTLKAQKATGQWGDKQGLKLEGTPAQPARVTHPQLDVAAPKIEVAFDDNRQFKGVVATGGVEFKVSLTQKDGAPIRVEAKCDNANLKRTDALRVLTLNGGVDGWFQSGDGPRNQLRGQTVIIKSQPDSEVTLVADIKGDAQGIRVDVPPPGKAPPGNAAPDAKPVIITAQNAQLRQSKNGIDADVDGGAQGVRLEIPALANNEKPGALSVGAVVITSQRASVRQADGIAHLTGNAHAVSGGEGQAKFDVSADDLTITRAATGEINALKTNGRTRLKLDLPPDPNAKPLTVKDKKAAFGKPNYLEIEADTATADLAKNALTFDGNLKGFYRLPIVNDEPNTAPNVTLSQDYPFSGEHAVISYAPEVGDIARGLNIVVEGDKASGKQAIFKLPGFTF